MAPCVQICVRILLNHSEKREEYLYSRIFIFEYEYIVIVLEGSSNEYILMALGANIGAIVITRANESDRIRVGLGGN